MRLFMILLIRIVRGDECMGIEGLVLLIKLKRELRKVLDKDAYEKAVKVLERYQAEIEERIAGSMF